MSIETGKKIFFAAFCAFIIQFLSINGYAETSSSPATNAVSPLSGGAVSGSGTVTPELFTGTMSYSIPIEVPAGRKGMIPALSLIYGSGNGNGWVGVGWDLDLGAIERSAKNGIIFSGDSGGYVLRMGGSAIDLISDSTPSVFRAKIEGGFLRIKKQSGTNGDYWEVTDKAGTRYLYGRTSDTRQDDPNNATNIFKWCLEHVEDTNGNYMDISYTKDQGQIYPDRIDYTGHSGLPTTNYVKFHLDDSRTDAPVMYSTNFGVKTASRLKTIAVFSKISGTDVPQRAYKLTYAYSASTGRSVIAGVQQYGKDVQLSSGTVTGGSSLPALTFASQDGGTGLTIPDYSNPALPNTVTGGALNRNTDGTYMKLGDFNGDGRMDYMWMPLGGDGRWLISYGTATGFTIPDYNNPALPAMIADGIYNRNPDANGIYMITGDFNGDGKMDYMWIPWGGDGRWLIAYGTDTGFTIPDNNNPALPAMIATGIYNRNPDTGGIYMMTGDFNGDGKTDYMWIPWGTDRWLISYGTDTGLTIPDYNNPALPNMVTGGFLNRHTNGIYMKLGDFNGDGKTDYMWIPVDGDGRWLISYGTATGLTIPDYNNPALPGMIADGIYNRNPDAGGIYMMMTGDFNGDGKTDYMWIPWGRDRWLISYGTGTGLTIPDYDNPALPGTIPGGYLNRNTNNIYMKLGDFNGDGKTDFMWIPDGSEGRWLIAYSTGSGFTIPDYNNPALPGTISGGYLSRNTNGIYMMTGDFNGDGKTDFMWIPNGYDRWLIASANIPMHAPDLLTTVSNGIGGTTTIAYTPSTQYTNTQLPFPVQTVSSVTACDNYTSSCVGTSSTTNYTYSGGFFYVGEKDFRGFNYIKTTGPAGPNGERSVSETWFHQGNETNIISENTTTADLRTLANVTTGYMKGEPYRTRVSNASNAIYAETSTTYSSGTTTAPFFNPSLQVDMYSCDGKVSLPSTCAGYSSAMHTQTVYTYGPDDIGYGNVTRIDQYGDVSDSNNYSTVVKTYAYNPTNWIVGLPASETVYQGIGTTNQVSHSDFYYDGVADCNTPSTNQIPDKGNLTRAVRWFNGGTSPELRTAYDDYGNLTCSRDANGNTTTFLYDSSFTFLRVVTDPLGKQAVTQYYGVDNVQADNGLYGQVKSVTDPNGATATTLFDPFGRKVSVTLPDGTSTTWAYNIGAVGSQNVQTTNAVGLSIWTYFDGMGRTILAKKSGPDSKIIATNTLYNATGTVAQSSLPYFYGTETPRYTTFTYDPMGRVTRSDSPDGTRVLGCYDKGVTVSINANNQKKRETKNVQGNLIKVEEYLGAFTACTTEPGTPYAMTAYEYDVLGNLLKVTDAESNQTTMQYDTLGRKTSMSDPDMSNWTYAYYPNGKLYTQTDAKGQTITFTYDALNRVVLKHYPSGPDVVYTYDISSDATVTTYPVGRLSIISDATGTTQYFYDILGRTTKTIKTIDGQSYTSLVAYDDAGRLSSLQYPSADNEIVNYAYDGGGNLSLVSAPTGSAYISYANYNAFGQAGTAAYGNGVTTTYQYLATNNRLQNITTVSAASQIVNLTYSYDDGGNITGITDNIDNTKSQAFTYDDINRLIQAQSTGYGGTGVLSYFYDQIGNFTSKEGISYTYDSAGSKPHAVRSTSDGKAYAYDVNGNMISDGTRTIAYNYDNMPQSIIASSATTTFVYDGNGARVKKSTSTGDDIYLGKLYECKAGVCTKYIFAGDSRIAMKTSSNILYYHQDHLGSTRAVTDMTGTEDGSCANLPVRIAGATPTYFATLQGAYNAASNGDVIQARAVTFGSVDFPVSLNLSSNVTVTIDGGYDCGYTSHAGNTELVGLLSDNTGTVTIQYFSIVITGAPQSANSIQYLPFGGTLTDSGVISVNHKYTSQELDAETGLYNYNARFYNPVLGRFISPDTIIPSFSDPQHLNRYSYVRNNPLLYTDPTGHSLHLRKLIHEMVPWLSANDKYAKKYAWFREIEMAAACSTSVGCAAYAYYITDLEGGSPGQALKAAVIAGATAYAFENIDNMKAGADSKVALSVKKVALSGAVGGTSAALQHGSFQTGFEMSAGFSVALEIYKRTMSSPSVKGYDGRRPKLWPDSWEGAPKDDGVSVIMGNNNWGNSYSSGATPAWYTVYEGSALSKIFVSLPGMEPTSEMHDVLNPTRLSDIDTTTISGKLKYAWFFVSAPVSAGVVGSALLYGTPGVQITVDNTKK